MDSQEYINQVQKYLLIIDIKSFGEMFASHLIYSYVYPFLSKRMGISFMDFKGTTIFTIYTSAYSDYFHINEDVVDNLLLQLNWISSWDDHGYGLSKKYTLAYGTFLLAKKEYVFHPQHIVQDPNRWGVSTKAVNMVMYSEQPYEREHVLDYLRKGPDLSAKVCTIRY
jgi:hypothetical protein